MGTYRDLGNQLETLSFYEIEGLIFLMKAGQIEKILLANLVNTQNGKKMNYIKGLNAYFSKFAKIQGLTDPCKLYMVLVSILEHETVSQRVFGKIVKKLMTLSKIDLRQPT